MNPACVGFIPADTESEESYTTIWNAYRKALHALLYKVKRCCIHACVFCTEIENILSHPAMGAHKESDDFSKHLHHLVPQILFCWDAGAFIARPSTEARTGRLSGAQFEITGKNGRVREKKEEYGKKRKSTGKKGRVRKKTVEYGKKRKSTGKNGKVREKIDHSFLAL